MRHLNRPTPVAVCAAASLLLLASCGKDESTAVAVRTETLRGRVSDDWPAIHGPHQDSSSSESRLEWSWPPEGPPLLWEKPIGNGYAVPVAQDERLVVFHRVGDQECLECLDAETGDQRWITTTDTNFQSRHEYSDGPYATPALTSDSVVSLSAEGVLRKHAIETGQEAWSLPLASEYESREVPFAVGTSPLIDHDLVIVNIGGTRGASGIVAVHLDSGVVAWTATDHGGSYATPRSATIHGEDYLFVLTARALVALGPSDGRVRWQTPFGLKGGPERVTAVSPLVVGDLVVLTAGPGAGALVLQILPNDRFKELWRDRRALDSQFNNLTTNGRELFGFTSMWNGSAELRCLDLMTGSIGWGHKSELRRGSSLLVDGKLVLLGENGHLAVFDASPDPARQWYFSRNPLLAGPTYSAPSLHRGRLYLRNEKQLLCLNLRPSRGTVMHGDPADLVTRD